MIDKWGLCPPAPLAHSPQDIFARMKAGALTRSLPLLVFSMVAEQAGTPMAADDESALPGDPQGAGWGAAVVKVASFIVAKNIPAGGSRSFAIARRFK